MYLICSLAFFVSKPLAEAISHRSGRQITTITIKNPDGSTTPTPEMLEQLEGGLPARIFGRERLVRAVANYEQWNREIAALLPKAMFILLPMFALLTMLAWRRRLRRYPAHLYFALHIHSAWFGAMAVLTIAAAFVPSPVVAGLIGAVVLAYVVGYALLAARLVFADSWVMTLAKATAVSVAYSVCLVVVQLGLLAYALTKM